MTKTVKVRPHKRNGKKVMGHNRTIYRGQGEVSSGDRMSAYYGKGRHLYLEPKTASDKEWQKERSQKNLDARDKIAKAGVGKNKSFKQLRKILKG